MSEPILQVVRLSPSELRTLFLFEALDDDELDWLSETRVLQGLVGRRGGLHRG